jgi:hypothetical protein
MRRRPFEVIVLRTSIVVAIGIIVEPQHAARP